jgi:hypothetical protein
MVRKQASVGMKVIIFKNDKSKKKGWAPTHTDRHLGLTAEISKIHSEQSALHLKMTDPIIGEVQWWWYHMEDLQPTGQNKFNKKVTFDPNNLVVGV